MTVSAAPSPAPAFELGRVAPFALRPVFVTLRFGLHVLVVGLALFVMIRALLADEASEVPVTVLTVAFLACYGAGVAAAHRNLPQWARVVWLTALLALWVGMSAITPDAAFLAFPLFFLELHVLAAPLAVPLVVLTFGLSVWGTATHLGFAVGTVLGPLISAGVAIVIGLGYRAMAQETKDRQALILDLIATREELAAASREAGTLAERQRIAREIHDTVAQGLSSIQMLLHAAERDIDDRATREKLELARATASDNLAETRRFIRELSPPSLDEQTLPAALRRLAATVDEQASQAGSATRVSYSTSGTPVTLPMAIDATLLRIAQGALANVLRHARATRAELTLSYLGDEVALDIVDDGIGFDPAEVAAADAGIRFGLRAMRERAEREGGTIELESGPGDGTAISVRIPVAAE
ncbi:signal transduction histidine kinase [Agromyces terreus]|uniref:Oxygen sensor histidine kinase NreB n=1 Tax=Agromyces terreus TaxID=424795 RepID=A0A9X2KCU9_9MICO|nr:sensor histidine kinase [Agromyces terreus]MCP2371741.1 signal transduction histidine kinase [Agromyces terreus]